MNYPTNAQCRSYIVVRIYSFCYFFSTGNLGTSPFHQTPLRYSFIYFSKYSHSGKLQYFGRFPLYTFPSTIILRSAVTRLIRSYCACLRILPSPIEYFFLKEFENFPRSSFSKIFCPLLILNLILSFSNLI